MQINTNIVALQANTNLLRTNRKLSLSMERLSSGLKINSVADDPAGLAISNKLRSQIKGLNLASKNALDGVSVMQTAEGALGEINSMIQRTRELAVQAANDANGPDDRIKMQAEIDELIWEIDDIVGRTEFNSKKLLNGELSRLTVNRQGTARADNIFKTLYVSSDVPNGSLSYQIDKLGTPAKVEGSVSGTTTFSDTEFSINGEAVKILSTDSMDDVLAKIREACSLSDIEVRTPDYPAPGPLILTSAKAGVNAHITIEPPGSFALSSLGLASGTAKGVDPVISGISFTDDQNKPSSDFCSNSPVSYDGNRIEIKGAGGQKINIELQMKVLEDGTYQMKNGTIVNDDGTLASGSAQDLSVEITRFGELVLQIGTEQGMEMVVDIPKVSAKNLGLDRLNFKTIDGASEAIERCDAAISQISKIRSMLGASQNRLEYSITGLEITAFNTEVSRSRIIDTDMAQEMTTYTQMNVIAQAGISILAQANQRPQQLLQLLG